MFAVVKVMGDSMSPTYQEGDFVVINTIPFCLHQLQEGDVIVFHHGLYGILIKRVKKITSDEEIYVVGTHENSLDSQRVGPISKNAIKGKVICHIPKPKK